MKLTTNGQQIAEIAMGLVIVLIGAVVLYDASHLKVLPHLAAVGPKVFPTVIASGLLLIGAKLIWDGVRGSIAFEGGLEIDFLPVLVISAGFVFVMAVIKPLGWPVASTGLFVIGAFAFGNRNLLWAALYGLMLAGLTVLVFNLALGLRLPMGEVFTWTN